MGVPQSPLTPLHSGSSGASGLSVQQLILDGETAAPYADQVTFSQLELGRSRGQQRYRTGQVWTRGASPGERWGEEFRGAQPGELRERMADAHVWGICSPGPSLSAQ